jgi:hypothetical protein
MSTFDIRTSKVLCPTGVSAAGVEPNAYAAQGHPSGENRMNLAKILRRWLYSGSTAHRTVEKLFRRFGRKGFFEGCKNVLFHRIGGPPALYAYLESFMNPLCGQKR